MEAHAEECIDPWARESRANGGRRSEMKLAHPEPRGTTGFPDAAREPSREVSTRAHSLAVGGVCGELVSAGESLLCRENTGNSIDSGLDCANQAQGFRAIPWLSPEIPFDKKQGIDFDEQGIPGMGIGL